MAALVHWAVANPDRQTSTCGRVGVAEVRPRQPRVAAEVERQESKVKTQLAVESATWPVRTAVLVQPMSLSPAEQAEVEAEAAPQEGPVPQVAMALVEALG